MGVYQSRTQPEVRQKAYNYLVFPYELAPFSNFTEKALQKMIKRRYGIPMRVVPDKVPIGDSFEWQFRWFEVVTD